MKLIQAAHIFYDYLIRDENDNVMATKPALSDFSLEIPQYGTKHSLNVSVSVGVVLWEMVRG